jgi:UbiD family decarboxylase
MRNIRVYLEELKANGHLAEVEAETDWMLEASAIAGMSSSKAGPAIHFKNVKGSPEGYSLAGGIFAGPGNLYLEKNKYWHRACIAMGLSADTTYSGFLNTMMERMTHQILPMEVDTGPVKEVWKSGEDVDIQSFPIPFLHKGDGGRYGTLQTMIVKDLESDRVVWQNVRSMVIDGTRLAIPIAEGSALGEIFAKYKAVSRPMPCCVAIGAPPLVTMTSFLPLEPGTSPAAVAGGLNLDPIELVKAETNDLLVPAQAEVVIEGEIVPGDVSLEGPFPEYWFYTERAFSPVMRIRGISQRRAPIIPFSVDGVKPSDSHVLQSLMLSFELYRRCLAIRNYPMMWIQVPIEFNLSVVVVSAPILFSGYVLWMSRYILSQAHQLGSLIHRVIVVDEKTPSISLEAVVNDTILRIHPNKGYHYVDGMSIGPNVRYASDEQKCVGVTSGLYMDTSWPKDWTKDDVPRRIDMEGSFPKELLDKVVANYNRLGYKGQPVVYNEAIIPF